MQKPHEVRLQVIRSSSSGNCTVIWSDGEALFIDAGITRTLLDEFMSSVPVRARALLVTHAHADHLTNPAVNFFGSASVPIYMGHNDAIGAFMKYLPALRKYRSNVKIFSGPFHTGNFAVEPFALEHDSVGGCFGFAVKIHGKKIVVATDLVNAPSRLKPFFKDADAVVFESNHDIEMLRQSSRPDYLKRRIMERGHLSNEKSANFLVEAFESGSGFPTHLFLAHISHECNTHAKAKQAYQRIFLPFCGDRTNLHLTHRDASTEVVVV